MSVAQQRSDAIAEVASHEIEAARKASLETVDKVASQLRRDAEIHCAEARAAGGAHVERIKLEADEMHASRIATQSARYDSIVGSKDAELSETRRQLAEVYDQLRVEWVEKDTAKVESTKVGEMYSHLAAEANEWTANEVKAHEAEKERLLAQSKKEAEDAERHWAMRAEKLSLQLSEERACQTKWKSSAQRSLEE